jgi:hypothetical protein
MADSPLKDEITDNASGPKEMEGDEGRVHQHSLKDMIEADKYLSGQNSASNSNIGLRFRKISPPGAI